MMFRASTAPVAEFQFYDDLEWSPFRQGLMLLPPNCALLNLPLAKGQPVATSRIFEISPEEIS
jgi:hypothetical protein